MFCLLHDCTSLHVTCECLHMSWRCILHNFILTPIHSSTALVLLVPVNQRLTATLVPPFPFTFPNCLPSSSHSLFRTYCLRQLPNYLLTLYHSYLLSTLLYFTLSTFQFSRFPASRNSRISLTLTWLDLLQKTMPVSWKIQSVIKAILDDFEKAASGEEHFMEILHPFKG